MKKLMRCTAAAVLAMGLGVGTASVSTAAETYPGGGFWSSGADCCSVWSNYWHGSKTHKASVQGDTFVTSGWKAANLNAVATAGTKLWGNKSYWDVK